MDNSPFDKLKQGYIIRDVIIKNNKMVITEISVWKDRKIQIEQYEPYTFAFGAKATLEPKEDPLKAYQELEQWVDKKLEIETLKWKNPQKLVRDRDKLPSISSPF